jgi:hypothetical protein
MGLSRPVMGLLCLYKKVRIHLLWFIVIFEFIPVVAVSIAVFGDMWQRGTNVMNKPTCSVFRVEGESAGSSEMLIPIHQTKWCQIQEYNNLKFRHFLLGSLCTSNNWPKNRLRLYYLNCFIFGKYKCIIKLYTFVSISETMVQDCISHFILREKTYWSDGE